MVARVSYPIVGAQTANERSRGLALAGEVVRWLITGEGMLTYSPSIVGASSKVLEESATPDTQCTFAPGSFKNGQIGELEETPASAPPGSCGPCRAAMSGPIPGSAHESIDKRAVTRGGGRRQFTARTEKCNLPDGIIADRRTSPKTAPIKLP